MAIWRSGEGCLENLFHSLALEGQIVPTVRTTRIGNEGGKMCILKSPLSFTINVKTSLKSLPWLSFLIFVRKRVREEREKQVSAICLSFRTTHHIDKFFFVLDV